MEIQFFAARSISGSPKVMRNSSSWPNYSIIPNPSSKTHDFDTECIASTFSLSLKNRSTSCRSELLRNLSGLNKDAKDTRTPHWTSVIFSNNNYIINASGIELLACLYLICIFQPISKTSNEYLEILE